MAESLATTYHYMPGHRGADNKHEGVRLPRVCMPDHLEGRTLMTAGEARAKVRAEGRWPGTAES